MKGGTQQSLAGDGATASKKGKAKGKKCPKGKKPATVKKNGKKVTVCKRKKAKPKVVADPPPKTQGLFSDPGRTLEEAEAKEYLKPYLPNSTFTDCVPGWPACGGFENRDSHSSGSTFYQCWLRPTSGSDVKSVGEYGVQKAKVQPRRLLGRPGDRLLVRPLQPVRMGSLRQRRRQGLQLLRQRGEFAAPQTLIVITSPSSTT